MKAYLVNAFTYKGRGGNQAGVVLCREFPKQETMQRMAEIIGFSETAFICPGQECYNSRFFTPQCEVPVCGHATIAAFTLLGTLEMIRDKEGTVTVMQNTKAGKLPVYISFRQGMVERVYMEQTKPCTFGTMEKEDVNELYASLGLETKCVGIKGHMDTLPEIISTGLPDIIAPVLTKKALDGMKPDFGRLARLSHRLGVVGAHAFTLETENAGFTARCRNFGPAVGINEEAATGTSNGALGYYLYKRGLLKDGEMACEQGFGMGRPSAIYVSVGQDGLRVGGEATITGEKDIRP